MALIIREYVCLDSQVQRNVHCILLYYGDSLSVSNDISSEKLDIVLQLNVCSKLLYFIEQTMYELN